MRIRTDAPTVHGRDWRREVAAGSGTDSGKWYCDLRLASCLPRTHTRTQSAARGELSARTRTRIKFQYVLYYLLVYVRGLEPACVDRRLRARPREALTHVQVHVAQGEFSSLVDEPCSLPACISFIIYEQQPKHQHVFFLSSA